MLAWPMVPKAAVSIQGEPKVYSSSASRKRSFCPTCGTGLFFTNAPLDQMGMMQVRIAALDDPNAIKPKVQVQIAERVGWMASLHGFAFGLLQEVNGVALLFAVTSEQAAHFQRSTTTMRSGCSSLLELWHV
ncbi:GFA family protein [Bradyrhizobium sp. Ash2021]|uniref:GFA family protein n=1 Tax=Bradyrhizobium sp. Ash2021 TaxID=2954771 RepID=UPI002814B7A6|nr:GFA family protein [Bradyrhizobium sp. Ash2021]WMT71186.1 GFA family protein [Bradyrhizobium sp. Ash2021]